MYTIEYLGIPEKQEDLDAIFDLMCACDQDFVPSLSSRNSTWQHTFGANKTDGKPYAYFECSLQQPYIAARDENGRMVGFLSFIPDHVCEDLARYGAQNYMSTACVYPEHRGKGLVNRMYDVVEQGLLGVKQSDYVTVRTWSTNLGQMHSFNKRGYIAEKTIRDDRGPGIDTVYFVKKVR